MKKVAIRTLLAASVVASASSFAADVPSATFVLEGYVPSTTPSTEFIVTGIGGAADVSKGTLTINKEGVVTTSVPVMFEVRKLVDEDSDPTTPKTIGDIATSFKLNLVSSSMTAGSAAIDNATNKVYLNAVEVTKGTLADSTAKQNSITFENASGFNMADVGSGAAVQASVVVMIESATAA